MQTLWLCLTHLLVSSVDLLCVCLKNIRRIFPKDQCVVVVYEKFKEAFCDNTGLC